eukprot:scaffold858_cov123-Cylindrotheca_fusiformis.AAC.2
MVVSQTAMQATTVATWRVVELEEQTRELTEELQFALENPSAHKEAAAEVQLKYSQESNLKLEAENERLRKLNRIQKEATFELSVKHKKKGGYWW